MNDIDLETKYLPHLKSQLSLGNAVLFLGAGFSLDAKNILDNSFPSAWELTEKIWDVCYPNEPVETGTLLQDIFDHALKRNKNGLQSLINNELTAKRGGYPDWYSKVLSLPWRRIYTLNADNLVEVVMSDLAGIRRPHRVSAADSNCSINLIGGRVDIVHLNGDFEDGVDKLTFSRQQYARRANPDNAYVRMCRDLAMRTVVFIGSSLEEGPLWEHLELRGKKHRERNHNELRPRSYLVVPSLPRAKTSLLDEYNVALLPMKGREFVSQVVNSINEVSAQGHAALDTLANADSASYSILRNVADLSAQTPSPTEYLLGEQVAWSDVTDGKVGLRDCFEEAWDKVQAVRSSSNRDKVFVVTGTAGTGKSSLHKWLAMRLSGEGESVGWVDPENRILGDKLVKTMQESPTSALFIADADIYGATLSRLLREIKDVSPATTIVLELRASKVDQVLRPVDLRGVQCEEFTVPSMTDGDVDVVLNCLDKFNRLGQLKGLPRQQQEKVFKNSASRQLLPAMYEATSGKRFLDRAKHELRELDGQQRFIYGLVSTASAHRFNLTKDEIVLALSDNSSESLNSIEALSRRRLILRRSDNQYSARHRVIGQLVYDELVESGTITPVIRGLIALAASKVSENTSRGSRPVRMMKTFLNHDLIKRTMGTDQGRVLYGEFESILDWDAHYWLHRGALEIDGDCLDTAENFLNQAMNLSPDDYLIKTEWAFLQYKLANASPHGGSSPSRVQEAENILDSVIVGRVNMSAHAYHIQINQGMRWAKSGALTNQESSNLLSELLRKAQEATKMHPNDSFLSEAFKKLEAEVLKAAIS